MQLEADDAPPREEDRRLVRGLRDGDSAVTADFMRRFIPILLDRARELRVDAAERETIVLSFLDDLARRIASLAAGGMVPERSLHGYVIRAFHNEVFIGMRRRAREQRALDMRSTRLGDLRIVREACSEYLVRSAADPAADDENAPRALAMQLVTHLLSRMTTEEQRIFHMLSRHVPTREIAEQLGATHGGTRVRISRLRKRMHEEAVAYLASCRGHERDGLRAFLVRAGVITKED